MATKAISALSTAYATLQAGDNFAVDRAGVTGRTTRAQLVADLKGDLQPIRGEGSVVSTSSGTDFTQAIPDGVRRITVILNACSLASSTEYFLLRIGDSGGVENADYLARTVVDMEGTPGTIDRATGFVIHADPASASSSVTAVIERLTATTWHCRHYGIRGNGQTIQGYGTKTLSGDLTQVQLASTGSTAFDGGSVLFRWEF